jgi:hemerythrin-like domain-containing protein
VETDETATDLEANDVLAREHRLIERVLDCLGRLCDEARRHQHIDGEAATLAVRFLREFADQTHHLKEEKILFPAIDARAFFPGCGLMYEHGEGRERVRSMAGVLARAIEGDVVAIRLFVRKARSLIGLLRDHIAKEDDCLASTVRTTFSREERQELALQFEEMERKEIGENVFATFLAIAERLEASHGPGGRQNPA